jgi:hypothetical protein
MSDVQTLQFYTTGEAYTGMMVDFFRSGEFGLFEELLGDGNLNHEQKLMAFRLRMRLEGDTRTKEGLSCHFDEEAEGFNKTLYFSIMTCIRGLLLPWEESKDRLLDLFQLEQLIKRYNNPEVSTTATERKTWAKMKTLLKYYSLEEIMQRCSPYAIPYALRVEGYEITYDALPDDVRRVSGLILRDGGFVECGYMDHINLMPILYRYGLVDASCWTDSADTIHVTSGQAGGGPTYSLLDHSWKYIKSEVTPEQVETLWRMRQSIHNVYGENQSIADCVRGWGVRHEGHGGKYGHLVFLKDRFPNIRIPRFSKRFEDFEPDSQIFMRTSPTKSLPGLLNSLLVKANPDSVYAATMRMAREFKAVRDIRNGNELSWFFQEFLTGLNGVIHVRRMPDYSYSFSYQASSEQGAVVGGKLSTDQLSEEHLATAKQWAMQLADELKVDGIQIEFVVDEHGPCFVQLRLLENEFEKGLGGGAPDNAFIRGKSFSNGRLEVSPDEILVVKEDADSHELIGKKALIVEGDVEFSHILALSKALRIPSMYATGPVDFGGRERFNFSTRLFEAYCNDIHKG